MAQLEPRSREAISRILDLLAREPASVSSVTEPRRAWDVHVADSLSGLDLEAVREASRIADIGSGAGFPGLVLAVALPAARVDLVESVGRKCRFLAAAVETAALGNAEVLCARSEEVAAGPGREAYDVVTARAVGRLSTLAELASPLLREGGALIAWKGARVDEEEEELRRATSGLGMRAEAVIPVQPFPASQNRHLHLIRKVAPTPPGLPRRAGMAKKRPPGAVRVAPPGGR